jgi:hypothetical protein
VFTIRAALVRGVGRCPPPATHLLARLAKDPGFLEYEILPLLEEAQDGKDCYVARRYDDEDDHGL